MSSSLRVGSQPSTQNPGQTTTQTSPTNASNLASIISNNPKTVAIGIALLAGAKIIHSYPTATLLCVLGLGAFYLYHASSQKTEEQTTAKTEYKDLGSIQTAKNSIKPKMTKLREKETELANIFLQQRMSIKTDLSLTEQEKTGEIQQALADYKRGLQEFMKEKNAILAEVCEIHNNLCKLPINKEEQPQFDKLETYLTQLKNEELPQMGLEIGTSQNAIWEFLEELTIEYNQLIKNAAEVNETLRESERAAGAKKSEEELRAAYQIHKKAIQPLEDLMSKLQCKLEKKLEKLRESAGNNIEIDTLIGYCELLHANSKNPYILSATEHR